MTHDSRGIDIENYFLKDIGHDINMEIYYNPELVQINKALSDADIPARFGPAVRESGTLKTRVRRENGQKVLLMEPAIYTLREKGEDTSGMVSLRETLTRFEEELQKL